MGSINRAFGYVFGAVYIAVGLAGFALTEGIGLTATQGRELILFELNPLHNIVHLAVGALLVGGAAMGARVSRGVNATVGSVYLLVGILGLLVIGGEANILALNAADNVLHFATAVLALLVATRRETRTQTVRTERIRAAA